MLGPWQCHDSSSNLIAGAEAHGRAYDTLTHCNYESDNHLREPSLLLRTHLTAAMTASAAAAAATASADPCAPSRMLRWLLRTFRFLRPRHFRPNEQRGTTTFEATAEVAAATSAIRATADNTSNARSRYQRQCQSIADIPTRQQQSKTNTLISAKSTIGVTQHAIAQHCNHHDNDDPQHHKQHQLQYQHEENSKNIGNNSNYFCYDDDNNKHEYEHS